MLHIVKGACPTELTAYRRVAGASYEDAPKDCIRSALLRDQGHLCAYCMARITKKKMKIEHWIPRHPDEAGKYTKEQCDANAIVFDNMLGVCTGHLVESIAVGENRPQPTVYQTASVATCDTARANQYLKITPLSEQMVSSISYSRNGEITSSDPQIADDLTDILKLNHSHLVSNRREAQRSCVRTLTRQKQKGQWTKAMIEQQIKHYTKSDSDGMRIPYAGAVLYFLKRHAIVR